MPLFLIHRPRGAEHLRRPSLIHGAIVEAADAGAALEAADALVGHQGHFTDYAVTEVAATAADGFCPALTEGDLVGDVYQTRRGA